ncbi:MAG: nucleotide exchange factor GrpE [Candidatus Puniceispirillum sp.]|nr:nucleotide exchange factor GrpE [Candidatus Pelagibacter sp.]MBA4283436.1 nucleotide exchange factor GrpE [Candidatus Puniceispirillum sp.]
MNFSNTNNDNEKNVFNSQDENPAENTDDLNVNIDAAPELSELDMAQNQATEFKNNWLRSEAEIENLRKRFAKEKDDLNRYASLKLARDLVSVIDNLRRAHDAAEKPSETSTDAEKLKSLVDGIVLIINEADTCLDRHHIKRLNPINEMFDPNFHQAMFEIESEDALPSTILNVVQDGYVLHDRIIRPALVGISKKKETA